MSCFIITAVITNPLLSLPNIPKGVRNSGSRVAEEIVANPMEADVVVTDHETNCAKGAELIREYDFKK